MLSLVAGCANQGAVPVEDRDSATSQNKAAVSMVSSADSRPGFYTVKKGDTLYGIALDNGQDYKDIAAWNNLGDPNKIQAGQQLRVAPDTGAPVAVVRPVTPVGSVEIKSETSPTVVKTASAGEAIKHEPKGGKQPYSDEALARARQAESAPKVSEAKAEPKPGEKLVEKPTEKPAEKPVPAVDDVDWAWPVKGKVQTPFAEGSSKGIDVTGKAGDPVLAAGNGTVSYAGAGLRGYGNLVVVKHNTTYLSVYAHNSKILVKEKQAVTKGMKIAEIGSTDADSPRLHFEIRRLGKPVDPQKFLPPQ